EVLADGQVRGERDVRGREVAPLQNLAAMRGERQTEDADLAGGRRRQAEQELDRRRLSGAVGPQEAEDLAARDGEGEAVDRREVAEAARQAGGLDGRRGGRRRGAGVQGTRATIRSGPPEPPAIFIGSATTHAPVSGTASRPSTFSSPGTLAAPATRWTWKSCEGP